MTRKPIRYLGLLALLLMLVAVVSVSAEGPQPEFVEVEGRPVAGTGVVFEPKGVDTEAVYIVRLQGAPLATYRGDVNGLTATSPAAVGSDSLDINSASSVAYRNYLADRQTTFLAEAAAALDRPVAAIHRYDITINGIAARMSPTEAAQVAKLPGVLAVHRDEMNQILTDVTPAFIGATQVWDGVAVEGAGTKGEGVIVGVIDTGIWPEHPSFEDDGTFPAPPAKWTGGCSTPDDASAPYTCNDKLVGVQHFLDGYISAVGGTYDGLFISGRDDNGHGTHTASTAAGNENVEATLLGVDRGTVSGIAPRAHVSSYKACAPQGCVTSDLIAAIDQAVADGVDVINYSIGGGASDPWADLDALAFLAARDAGVFVATSAGNSGPGAETLGSPADAPWITTVGASTSNRHFLSDITVDGPGEAPGGLYGVSVTDGITDYRLVDAEGIADVEGDDSGLCANPYPPNTFEATDVVLCRRGEVARVVRGDNVDAGGGGAVILYNPDPAQGLSTDNYVIPAVHVATDVGLALKQYVQDNPGDVTVSFSAGQAVLADDPRVTADMMADFSSRGPTSTVPDIIKPDVTGPGVQILAGHTPQCIDPAGGCGAPGQLFQAIQGTSMSSPHAAGAGALLVALHPDWSPSEIESALTMTGVQDVVKEDGETPADPFDMGGGRLDLTKAGRAGLVLDATLDEYLGSDPKGGGDPRALNIATMGNRNCVVECGWVRTVRNTLDESVDWNLSVAGLDGTVTPSSFTIAPGEKQEIEVTVNVVGLPNEQWAFGQLNLEADGTDTPDLHMPIAVSPNNGDTPDSVIIETRRNAGSYLIEDITAIEITDLQAMPYGLVEAEQDNLYLEQDPTNDISEGGLYDDLDQVFYRTVDVPANTVRLVAEVLESESPDVDMAVGFDTNGNGQPDADEEVCLSADSSYTEYCDIASPDEGTWWVIVMNWQASAEGAADHILLATAVVPREDAGNMSVEAPSSVPALDPFDVRIIYDLEDAQAGDAFYGALRLGSSPANPGNVGRMPINLYRLSDDVVKTADVQSALPGDTVTFEITVQPNVLNEDVDYSIVDEIPDGMTYVPDSAAASAGTVTVENSTVKWEGTLVNPNTLEPTYNVTTSDSDPLCDTGFEGYVDLEGFGISTQEVVQGDTVGFSFFSSGNPITFFGDEYQGVVITDDGFAVFNAAVNYAGQPWVPQEIPNPEKPNAVAAMLWQDMEIVYDADLNHGVSAATAGENVVIVEYDDIRIFEETESTYDFQIVMLRTPDDAEGVYEIVYAYDNLAGPLDGPLTIGVENEAATEAAAYVNRASAVGEISDGLMVCFDAVQPAPDAVTITYQATVDAGVELGQVLVNNAVSTTSTVGSKATTTSVGVYVGYPTFFAVIVPNSD